MGDKNTQLHCSAWRAASVPLAELEQGSSVLALWYSYLPKVSLCHLPRAAAGLAQPEIDRRNCYRMSAVLLIEAEKAGRDGCWLS